MAVLSLTAVLWVVFPQSASDAMAAAAAAAAKKPKLRVEDVYMDSEEEGEGMSKPAGEEGHEGGGGGGGGGGDRRGQSVMTSETESVDPEDQRDCFSQHSSSRASSTDLFIKGCSPGAESPYDHHFLEGGQGVRSVMLPVYTPAEIANYTEAFKQGWRREIVFRSTQNPSKGGIAKADIYYYAPSGKKLRSRVEIEDYLLRTGCQDLTQKNFTWLKKALGVSEEYEQIRHAVNNKIPTLTPLQVLPPSPLSKSTQETPTSTTASPTSTPRSSASLQLTQTPMTLPALTITSIPRNPSLTKSPQTVNASTIFPPSPVSNVSGSLATSVTSVTPVTSVAPVVAPAVTAQKVTYMYDSSLPIKRGRGRPRKNPLDVKRPKLRTTLPVPIMMKRATVGARRSAGPPPLKPAPGPPPLKPAPAPAPPTTLLAPHPPTTTTQVMYMTPQWPILTTPTPRTKQARKIRDPIVTSGHLSFLPPCPPKILTPMLMGAVHQRSFHCTGHCPLGGGSVPCLQCIKCLCLFHPECTCMPPQTVSIIQAGAAKFLCPNCYRENKENVTADKWFAPEPFEPLAYDPTSSCSSDSEEEGSAVRKVWVEDYTKVCVRPDTPLTPPDSPPSISPSPAPSLGPWRTAGSESRQGQSSDQPQVSAPVEALKNLPSTSGQLLLGTAGIGGQLVQIQQPGGPACFLLVQGGPGAPGGQQLSMPVGGGQQLSMPVGGMSMQQQQLHISSPLLIQQPQFQPSAAPLTVPPKEPVQQEPDKPTGKHYKEYYQAMSKLDNTFLGELSQRYRLLRHVFKYLAVRDLLVASEWETVRLRNVGVRDWSEFARFLEQRSTRNIDLRKMRMKSKSVKSEESNRGETCIQEKVRKASTRVAKASDRPGTPKDPAGDSHTVEKEGKETTQGDNEEASNSESQPPRRERSEQSPHKIRRTQKTVARCGG
ncbi:hypothetical protein GWK47_046728 [Chionoecetes opilio]|uniref:MBD domain-containing protein n=1 Tax=Chionoecetes opilio TaxID=41210 RepID=A0A8J4Y4F2_CHIOP|nr:hypothetical protein GWK47_046728 [Chionoecetes opilio]